MTIISYEENYFFEALFAEEKPVEWILESFVPKGGKLVLIGKPKAGKSHFALQMASAAALGARFLDKLCPEPCRVLYLNFEIAHDEQIRRMKRTGEKFEEVRGINPAFPDVIIEFKNITCKSPLFINSEPSARQLLESWIKDYQPDLVVYDPKRSMYNGNENDTRRNLEWCSILDEIAAKYSVKGQIVVHHAPKREYKEVVDRGAGSNALTGWADVVVVLERAGAIGQVKLEMVSRYEPDVEPRILAFRDGIFDLLPAEELQFKSVFERAVEVLKELTQGRDLMDKKGTTKLIQEAHQKSGISKSYLWQALTKLRHDDLVQQFK